jgi:ribosome-binding protein aMBF1 (putative translation factor)
MGSSALPARVEYRRAKRVARAKPHPGKTLVSPGSRFGSTLRAARRRVGLTQVKLSRRSELEKSYVCRLETGVRHPSRETVAAIAAVTPRDRVALYLSAGFIPPEYLHDLPALCAALERMSA